MTEGSAAAVQYRLLGPFEVLVDGTVVHCGGVKQCSVLAMLLLDANRLVPVSRLIDGLWEHPAERAAATVHVYVSNLRKALPRTGGVSPIVTTANGYLIAAPPESIDAALFSRSAHAAADAKNWHDDNLTMRHLDEALTLWRGDPLADFADRPFATAPSVALRQQRDGLVEDRFEVNLNLGRHHAVLPELEEAVTRSPLRESLWRLLTIALYRAGRQADALAALRRCREVLLDELGIDPGPDIRALELAVLQQDPLLAAVPAGRPALTGAVTLVAGSVGRLVLRVADEDPLEITKSVVIGRSETCDIVIDEALVSRQHAEIQRTPSGWLLTDVSLNGTLVNDVRVTSRVLVDGDIILIGCTMVAVELLVD